MKKTLAVITAFLLLLLPLSSSAIVAEETGQRADTDTSETPATTADDYAAYLAKYEGAARPTEQQSADLADQGSPLTEYEGLRDKGEIYKEGLIICCNIAKPV